MSENNLVVLDEKIKSKYEELRERFPNSKYLLLDFEDGLDTIEGLLYCVSKEPETYKDICNMCNQFSREGRRAVVLGDYNRGGMVGVQYEVR